MVSNFFWNFLVSIASSFFHCKTFLVLLSISLDAKLIKLRVFRPDLFLSRLQNIHTDLKIPVYHDKMELLLRLLLDIDSDFVVTFSSSSSSWYNNHFGGQLCLVGLCLHTSDFLPFSFREPDGIFHGFFCLAEWLAQQLVTCQHVDSIFYLKIYKIVK